MNTKVAVTLSLIVLAFLFSCKRDNVLENKINEVKEILGEQKVRELKLLEEDSLIPHIYYELYFDVGNIDSLGSLDSFYREIGVIGDSRVLLLGEVYYELNSNRVDYKFIEEEVKQYWKEYNLRDSLYMAGFNERRVATLKKNLANISMLDILLLQYPFDIVEKGYSLRSATERGSYEDNRPWDDTIKIIGKVVSIDSSKNEICIQVSNFNYDDPFLFFQQYSEGDTFCMDVLSYSRPVEVLNKQ